MLVHEIMHRDPISVAATATLEEAYAVMRERGIRHLPVVDGGRLAGVVTDRDLRLATSSLAEQPLPPTAQVREVMAHPVHTTHPRDPIEVAARTMRDLKIGCMPVQDGEQLVGIVTGVDILDALLTLTGVRRPSGRLELRLPDRPGELARVAQLLAARGVNVHSILSYPDEIGQGRIVLRVGTMEIRPLVEALVAAGVEVVWPPLKPCRS
jgi:acetoin utilization protein AcuB